jgi:hypothetical protein
MLSMPRGIDPLTVQRAAREFAGQEFSDHKYVMVLHDHQANPHVHLSVRAESKSGRRLNPRKADLHRWREAFAERLREWGIDAEATRRSSRGVTRSYEPLWRIKAREGRRLRSDRPLGEVGPISGKRLEALHAWGQIGRALALSGDAEDLKLARSLSAFVHAMPGVPDRGHERVRVDSRTPERPVRNIDTGRSR